nr:sigma-70 family RNA polymerase sigma factor [Microbispora sp. ATCC PTA-5024]
MTTMTRTAHPPAPTRPGTPHEEDEEFVRRSEPFRRELLAYCYRMLGSIHDAEDVLQETYLQAWRGYARFEGRSSMRTWMYRIATRACLKALEGNGRRPLPSGLGSPSDHPDEPPRPGSAEVPWLQPAPDALFGSAPPDPAAVAEARQTMRLGFVAALQYLSGRQRAVLILRDALAWRASEVADLLGTTPAAVNSALQRARAQLNRIAPTQDAIAEPADPARRALLDRYAAAFENADVRVLAGVLTDDAVWEMPPIPTWYAGRETVIRFLRGRVLAAGEQRMVLTSVNGQPAFGSYSRGGDGVYRAHALQVLTVTAAGVARVVAFLDAGLFALCGLPTALEGSA